MATIDASTVFSTNEYADMQELVKINDELKRLESRKKTLSENIKKSMLKLKIDKCSVGTASLSLTESSRRTISKDKKNTFIAELVSLNKKHLVITSIEPDLDSIFAEVDAGSLDKSLVDKYVTVTPVVTLRCN